MDTIVLFYVYCKIRHCRYCHGFFSLIFVSVNNSACQIIQIYFIPMEIGKCHPKMMAVP